MASGSKLILVMHPSPGVTAETGVFNIKREDGVYTMLMTDGRLISAPVDDLTDVNNVKELIRAIKRKSGLPALCGPAAAGPAETVLAKIWPKPAAAPPARPEPAQLSLF